MIIAALLNLVYAVLSVLLVFNLPQLPDTITTVLNELFGYIITGIGMLRVFIGGPAMTVLALLFQLVLLLNAAYFLWSFVFWVVRKIPMLNVKE